MARSMFDFISSTNALLEGVDAHEDWMRHLDDVRDTRAKAMADYTMQITTEFDDRAKAVASRNHSSIQESYNAAGMYVVPIDKVNYPKKVGLSGPYRYHTGEVLYYDYTNRAYFDPDTKRNLSIQEAKEKMGIRSRRLAEDQNRSDSEVAVFFDDRSTALAAYRVAQELGLKRGEVVYDPTVDPRYGVGQYAVRLAPHVRETKSEIFYEFLESIYDHIVESDIDQFEWLMAEARYGGVADKELVGKGNVLHTPDDGKFAADAALPSGSLSLGSNFNAVRLKSKDKRTKDGRLQFAATKLPCGRAARTAGVGANFGRRCWDGQIPDWAARAGRKAKK